MALTPVIIDSSTEKVTSTDHLNLTLSPTRTTQHVSLFMVASDDTGAFSPWSDLAGWDKFINAGDGQSDVKIAVYLKALDGSEADTIRVDHGSNTDDLLGWSFLLENVDLPTPLFLRGTEAIVGGAGDRTVAAIDADAPNLAFTFLAHDGGSGVPPRHSIAGAGWTKFGEQTIGSSGNGVSAVVATRNGSTDCTVGVPADDFTVQIQFALRAGGGVGIDGSLKAGGGSRVYVPFPQTVF